MRGLHTLNVPCVRVYNVRYASHRSKQNKSIDKSGRYNRMAICLNNIKPAQRLAANQLNRLNTSERDYAVSRATVMRLRRLLPNRFWSHLNRELARRCTTQSNEGD